MRDAQMKYQNVIFDLDGTLIDTDNAVLKTWERTLRECSFGYSQNELQRVLGVTEQAALRALNICPDEKFSNKWMRNYALFGGEAKYFAGVEEMLLRLKRSCHTVGVVTSRYRSECDLFFTHLQFDKYFDLVVCADDTERHKPFPAPLQKYMSLLKTCPCDCIYIGDMPTDIRCAKAAETASGLALWGKKNKNTTGDADYIFYHPADVFGNAGPCGAERVRG